MLLTSATVEHCHVKIIDSGCHGHWLWMRPAKRHATDYDIVVKLGFVT